MADLFLPCGCFVGHCSCARGRGQPYVPVVNASDDADMDPPGINWAEDRQAPGLVQNRGPLPFGQQDSDMDP